MHATVKTPKKTRAELAQHVYLPQLIQIDYAVENHRVDQSPLLASILRTYTEYDLMQDPYTKDLLQKQQNGLDVTKQLQKLFTTQKTYCIDQLRSLANKSKNLLEELGSSAVDWYLHVCLDMFIQSISNTEQLLDWSNEEKQHLLAIVRELPFHEIRPLPPLGTDHLSCKVEKLIDVLVNEAQNNPSFTGLVFVEQRVWISVLAEVLSTHPRTRNLFRVGTFLGTSTSSKRKAMIATLPEPRNQQTTLEDFRAGKINLILCTSVLEEGIDVSSCHLVICFERPRNLKSFVQRRGRARMQESKYFIFMPSVGGGRHPEAWNELEREMKRAYLDDMRQNHITTEVEVEEEGHWCLEIESTGARITFDDALPHLTHFCATLASAPHVDPRPQFRFIISDTNDSITAEITLPTYVDRAVRKAQSTKSWRTEAMAKKDVALQAYKALYHAGLVNDNLLPVRQETESLATEFQVPDHTPAMVTSSATMDPWLSIAQQYREQHGTFYRHLISIQNSGECPTYIYLLTVCPLPTFDAIELFWNTEKTFTATISSLSEVTLARRDIEILQSITHKILSTIHAGRMQEARRDFSCLLAPYNNSGNHDFDFNELAKWDRAVDGHRPASSLLVTRTDQKPLWGLIAQNGDNRRYMLQAIIGPQIDASGTQLSEARFCVTRVPKRRDFLHRPLNTGNANAAHTRLEYLDSSEAVVENLPTSYSVIALLLPSIMHRIKIAMIADTLRTTILDPIDVKAVDLSFLVRAITASSTNDENNYQRLEFLGDCILKFISSLHLMAQNPIWTESLLTGKKGRIVSNGFLARATLTAGLDKFIITKGFTGAKWTPDYWGDLATVSQTPKQEKRSSKLLADVVESLIGVAYVLGGFSKAFTCVQTLLPRENWTPIPEANTVLYETAPTEVVISNLDVLAPLIGYTFKKKVLLLEALTHASFSGPNVYSSYERLEFLGDAVLDYIITKQLYAHDPALSHQKMHAMRTAMVNAAFLAFSLVATTVEDRTISKSTFQMETHERALWQFMRFGSPQLAPIRDAYLQQHSSIREQVEHALRHDDEFPWHLLALTNAPKFLSDIVESVVGAIYVDSQGDFLACESFVRNLGILDRLKRILRDEVDCLHPKERLGHLAVNRSVEYVPVRGNAASPANPSARINEAWRCQVKVGGEDVGGIVGGLTRLCAETIAAWRANKVISGAEPGQEGSSEDDIFVDAEEHGGVALGDY
jgi:dsRNA-specific ribonuclease